MSRVQEEVDRLMGTCMIYPETEGWTTEEFREFDDLIFECERCGWWYEIGEECEQGMCEGCTEEEEAEEEEDDDL